MAAGQAIGPESSERFIVNTNTIKMKIFLTGIVIMMMVLACEAQSKYFKLLDASYEEWIAGIPGGGGGKEYYFKVVVKTKKHIAFDSVWVHDKVFKPIIVKGAVYDPNSEIHKNDTITIRIS